MLATLREEYVNAWVLAKELEGIAERSGDPDLARACELVRENYDYPVDSVLIAPDLRVVGHVNVHEPRARSPRGYLAFLREGLAVARGEPIPEEQPEAEHEHEHGPGGPVSGLALTPAEPTGSILDLVRRAKQGEPPMSFYLLDATAFDGPIELEIEVRVGRAKGAGKFELCAESPAAPGAMTPVETLEKLGRDERGTLRRRFEKGARFGLAAMAAAGSAEGDANAFLATVTVRAG